MLESISYCDSTPLFKCINYILDTVDERGAWGGKDFEDWEPIITALTLELLLNLDFTIESEWVIAKDKKLANVSLINTIKYLNRLIGEDGSFGEDIWDAARFGVIIERYDLKDRVTGYPRLKKFLLEEIAKNNHMQSETTWSGPGTFAVIIDYLDFVNESTLANELFNNLLSFQFPDGSFHGPVNEVNDELVHPIWHTTQVLMTALRRMPSEKDDRIKNMVSFICESQDRTKGCWRAFSHYGVYFTSYAIIALNNLKSKPTDVIRKAVLWLESQVSDSGKIRDAGGTIMGALALCIECPEQLLFKANIFEIRHLAMTESVVSDLNAEIERLQKELQKNTQDLKIYKSKFDIADIVLTKADAFKWAILLGIIGIGVSFFMGFLPQLISKPTEPTIYVLPQQQSESFLEGKKSIPKSIDVEKIKSEIKLKQKKLETPTPKETEKSTSN